MSTKRSIADTLKLIQQLMADMDDGGDDKGSDVIPTRFDVANAVQPAAKSEPKKDRKGSDVIPTRFDVANAVQPAKSEPEEAEEAEEVDMSFMDAMEAGLSKIKDVGSDVMEGAKEIGSKIADKGRDVVEDIQEAVEAAAEEPAEAPKAEAVYTPEQAQELFKVTHGTSFDPKSSMDAKKMKEIEDTLKEQGGLGDQSANQFALNIYRKYKYV